MSNSGFYTLQNTWKLQKPYNLGKVVDTKIEKFGAFSISAAVRGSYDRSINPWYRGGYSRATYYGVS